MKEGPLMTAYSGASNARCEHIHLGSNTLYTEVTGKGSPVVLIHGLAGSTKWWSRNIAALARNHEVHTVDLVGFGQNKGGRFVLAEAAGLLAEWMRRRGLRGASVIGHSMGGHIAVDLAAAHPELVSRLVLVDAALNYAGAPQPSPDLAKTLPYLPFAMLPVILPDAVRAGLKTLARATYQLVRTDMRPTLAKVRAKTLIVWGEHDPCVPLDLAYGLTHLVPCAGLAVIKGAGHVPQWEQPEAFNGIVGQFLADAAVAPQPMPATRRPQPQLVS
jgi:pimeloyl-ACP methyl ester carboxylesterase